jgi:hypothetical protein
MKTKKPTSLFYVVIAERLGEGFLNVLVSRPLLLFLGDVCGYHFGTARVWWVLRREASMSFEIPPQGS